MSKSTQHCTHNTHHETITITNQNQLSGLDLTSSKDDDLDSFKTYNTASDEEADHSSLSSDDEEQQ
jgi:hypothetical protein